MATGMVNSSLSPSNSDTGKKIKILCCTANMGNEQPDLKSLSEWIPKDGAIDLVLKDQPYPIRGNMKLILKNAIQTLVDRGTTSAQTSCRSGSITPPAPGAASPTYFGSSINSSWGEGHVTEGSNGGTFQSPGNERESDLPPDVEKFAIIAIGMQEATFDLADEKTGSLLKNVKKVTTVVTSENYMEQSDRAISKGIKKIGTLVQKPGNYVLNYTRGDSEMNATTPKENSHSDLPVSENRGDDDTRFLHQALKEHLPSYTRAVSYQRGQMRLLVFFNEDAISLNVLGVKAQNTGRAGLANKGGIVAELNIDSGTRISFATAHLEAHEGPSKYQTRCSTIADIFRGTESSATGFDCDQSLASHFSFFIGDLNFRTRIEGFEPGSVEHVEEAHRLTAEKDWDRLNKYDELAHALREKDCLEGFRTPECWFPPTFKVHRMDGYQYNEKRSPSYTDRILYKGNHLMSEKVRPLAYEPIDHFRTSDHKPLRGAFEVQLNSTLRWRPVLVKAHDSFRMSTRSGRKIKGSKLNGPVRGEARSENLHLFLSKIECNIASEKYNSDMYSPSPCVSFVSTPSTAMKNDGTKNGLIRNLFRLVFKQKRENDSEPLTQKGWPRTKIVSHDCNPKWNEEVHFKVRTHDSVGTPIDLTGALLHVLVLDSNDSSHIIGSCTLNLAFIIEVSRTRNRNHLRDAVELQERPTRRKSYFKLDVASRWKALLQETKAKGQSSSSQISGVEGGRNMVKSNFDSDGSTTNQNVMLADNNKPSEIWQENDATTNPPNDAGATLPAKAKNANGESNGILLQRMPQNSIVESAEFAMEGPSDALKSAFHSSLFASSAQKDARGALKSSGSSSFESSIDSLNIHCIKIDEDITKYGRVVGRIKFTVDTWWLDDEIANVQMENRKATIPSAGYKANRRPGDRR
jgi:hypothetical protein